MFCHFAAATQGKFFPFWNSNIYVIKIGIRIRRIRVRICNAKNMQSGIRIRRFLGQIAIPAIFTKNTFLYTIFLVLDEYWKKDSKWLKYHFLKCHTPSYSLTAWQPDCQTDNCLPSEIRVTVAIFVNWWKTKVILASGSMTFCIYVYALCFKHFIF